MISKTVLALIFLTLAACSTTNPSVNADRIREGMDKGQVLDVAGNPARTFRSNSQDHWIYVFFKRNEEFNRQISFDNGKVVKIGPAVPKKNWDKEIEAAKRTDSGFKSMDGPSK